MAGDEHRMVFDIRGKRRHVVKFVYALLALLMAASLFLVTGAVNLGSLFGSSSEVSNLSKEYEEKAERVETELQKTPGDEALLLSLTRNRLGAGQQHLASEDESQIPEAVQQYKQASNSWSEYLKASGEPNPATTQQMASVLFTLAQASRTYQEAAANIAAAAEAEQIYAEKRPSLNSYSTLAVYQLYTGNYKEAEATNALAKKEADNKFQREQLDNTFESTKKTAVEFQGRLKQAEKAGKEAAESKNSAGVAAGAEVENPLGPAVGTGTLGE
jgi:Skp family chaperone for outer membrane proteins